MTDKQTPPAELIEAMARAIDAASKNARLGQDWEWFIPEATAALAALRETLVPAGWIYQFKQEPPVYMDEKREWASHPDWTETPLYALPEVKP